MTPSSGGSATSITCAISGTSGTYSGSFAPGNYVLALNATNSSGTVIASAQMDVVQIYQGLTSSWSGSIDDTRFVSSAKDITAFSFDAQGVTATISGTTISAIVPFTADYSKLVASFTTTGATVSVGGAAQASGTTANDFTAGTLSYLVTAADGTTQTYTVSVSGFTSRAAYGQSLAASGDFTHIILGNYGQRSGYGTWSGSVSTSTDGGSTWTQNSSASAMSSVGLRVLSVTASSDFTKLIFAVNQNSAYGAMNTGLYASSDSGSAWTYLGGGNYRDGSTSEIIALSSDGATLLGGKNATGFIWGTSSYIGLSADGGTTWTNQNSSGMYAWNCLSWSGNGLIAAGAPTSGYITISTDKGATWTAATGSGSRDWRSVALSSDGSRMIAVDHNDTAGGYIYVSSDGGTTWSALSSAGAKLWLSVAMSNDGKRIIAGTDGGYLYTSIDSGSTWVTHLATGTGTWSGAICNSDGSKAIVANGQAWVSY
jgi:Uncharacterized protein related to plant photosystem II stability/assembly factor